MRNEAFEAAIRANKDDPAPYLVYADWLQAKSDPLGEIIVLQHAGARPLETNERSKKKTPASPRDERLAELLQELKLPGEDLARFGWRWGFWSWMHIQNGRSESEPVPVVKRLFDMACCAALDDLRVGMLRWDRNHEDVPALLEAAAERAWARSLSRLTLGDIPEDIDMAHHCVGDVGAAVTRAFPALRFLKVHSGDQSWMSVGETFGLSGLPALEELVIETCSLSKERLEAVLEARAPKLQRLELWFGSKGHGANVEVGDLHSLFAGKHHAGVRHLGLRNAEITDAICEALPRSAIASRVISLDLSMGTMGDEGARALAERAEELARLEVLDVSDNFLSETGLRALKEAFPKVVSREQKDPSDPYRYVTVSE